MLTLLPLLDKTDTEKTICILSCNEHTAIKCAYIDVPTLNIKFHCIPMDFNNTFKFTLVANLKFPA